MQLEKWQRDLEVYKDINTTFIIEGNVHDKQPWIFEEDEYCEPISLQMFLYRYLSNIGYDIIVFFNAVDGFYNPYNKNMVDRFVKKTSIPDAENVSMCDAITYSRILLGNTLDASAVVYEMANTLAVVPDNLSDSEEKNFAKLMLISKNSVQAISSSRQVPLTNLQFFVTDKINDIPAWFYVNNPYVKTLSISKPEKEIRNSIISARIGTILEYDQLSDDERKETVEEFTLLTEGMSLVEIDGIITLCRHQNISIKQIKDAIFMFKYGTNESYWDKLNLDKIRNCEDVLTKRVKGQKEAISKVSSIIKRACLGLSDIQGGSNTRPKGVLFFAGPTGTGKTELAKTIAEMIFGDESFLTRFDMSEYGQPHSDQKLLGAPPGYVGYSAGGQLTNAIKEKPFSVLLFDEIEKAHPSILDKFLQILEDGRLTDSSGETVYFSESLIIFTSNLGITKRTNSGSSVRVVSKDMSYEEIKEGILAEIKEYFKFEINRPEILNRMGDNFVVFDYIREDVAEQILNSKIEKIRTNLKKNNDIELIIEKGFFDYLLDESLNNLENGGRGIGNVIESKLINSVATILSKEMIGKGAKITIRDKAKDETGLPEYYL